MVSRKIKRVVIWSLSAFLLLAMVGMYVYDEGRTTRVLALVGVFGLIPLVLGQGLDRLVDVWWPDEKN